MINSMKLIDIEIPWETAKPTQGEQTTCACACIITRRKGKILSNLRIVQVEEEEPDREPIKVRAFHNVSDGVKAKGEFHHIDVIKANEDMTRNVINNARTELEIFYNKYVGLCDVCGIMEEFILKKKGDKR